MAKKGKTIPKNKKKPTKKKKTTKPQKQERDLMWLFLKILLVVAIVIVIIILVKRYSKPSIPQQIESELVETEQETTQEESDEKLVEEVKEKEKSPNRVVVSYSNLEIPKWETTTSQQLVTNLGYTSSYNTSYGIPNWVAYEITRSEATSQEAERKDKFMPDPKVKGRSATNADYKGSGYDKGHMAPAADMKWSQTVMDQSFYFTNICPQAPGLNRGAWKNLEEDIRLWAIRDSALVVICGPLFTQEPVRYIPQTQVAIPDAYFKVVCSPYTTEPRGIAFIFPNAKASKHPREYVTTINSVEQITGMDFLTQLPDETENQIEETSNYALWE
ncbi:MAG: DNA/RNA non-specific endonuclease [Bacteroidaceae bacterium]|nr:DNA/RNA non-specific endonuclease [Bacteroidaceae bacterium]